MSHTNLFLHNGTEIVNSVLVDDNASYIPPEGLSVLDGALKVGIGYRLVNNQWVAPPGSEEKVIVISDEPSVLAAKQKALDELKVIGVSDAVAKTIVGLA